MIAPSRPLVSVEKSKPASTRLSLEKAALYHAGFLLIFATWGFGGNVDWAQISLSVLGSLGIGITVLEFLHRRRTRGSLQPFTWLWPLAVFAALVLLSAAYPNLTTRTIEGATVFVPRSVSRFLPSSARPELALRALALFIALYLPCFNLAIAVRSRRFLRGLLWTAVINAFLLAVFGSLQKLTHASGLYFGAVPSPNTRFFSTFIYQNHWGAFALLHLAIGLGLLFQSGHDPRYRSFFQSPAFLGLVAVLFLATSIPLSASRSCTILAVLLLGCALLATWRRFAQGRLSRRAGFGALAGASLLIVLAFVLARPIMQSRLTDTQEQWARMRESGSIGGRAQLYGDTWQMAKDRLLFGWGLASYPWVFSRYNRQVSTDRLPVYYEDAHSDWLQSVAEAGLVGTLSRVLLFALPLWSLRRLRPLSSTVHYLLLGCAVILLYATVEFPFGNAAVTLSFGLIWFAAIRLAQLAARESRS